MFLNEGVVREAKKKSGPGNQTEPLQPNPTKPILSTRTYVPAITMLPVLLVLNAGYYGSTHTAFTGCERKFTPRARRLLHSHSGTPPSTQKTTGLI